jgi:hypothetical protein
MRSIPGIHRPLRPSVSKGRARPVWLAGCLAAGLSMITLPSRADIQEPAKSSHGLIVYAGVMPGFIVKGHPQSHPEATMHGGPPFGSGSFHLVFAIFDEKTGARVEDARVSAKISLRGHLESQAISLDRMTIGDAVTYGGYVTYGSTGLHAIDVSIERPGLPEPVHVQFIDDYRKVKP